jgi:hypothetical protein
MDACGRQTSRRFPTQTVNLQRAVVSSIENRPKFTFQEGQRSHGFHIKPWALNLVRLKRDLKICVGQTTTGNPAQKRLQLHFQAHTANLAHTQVRYAKWCSPNRSRRHSRRSEGLQIFLSTIWRLPGDAIPIKQAR